MRGAAPEARLANDGAGPSSDGIPPVGVSGSAPEPSDRQPGNAAESDSRHNPKKRVAFAEVLSSEAKRVDESYFDSYSYFDIHREMLGDKVLSTPSLLHAHMVTEIAHHVLTCFQIIDLTWVDEVPISNCVISSTFFITIILIAYPAGGVDTDVLCLKLTEIVTSQ